MKDRLDAMFERQTAFQNRVFPRINPEADTKEFVLGMVSELDELLDAISWKIHRKDVKVLVRNNVLQELVDLFKYILATCVHWGFSADDLFEEFLRKSDVVEQMWHQEKELSRVGEKIAGVDIDGVLADYATAFIGFLHKKLGIKIPEGWISSDTAFQHGIDGSTYEMLKHQYREGGEKRFIPAYPNAKNFLFSLRRRGFSIVLLTSRPYKKYKRMFADTMEWLGTNKLPYDAVIFDEDKNVRLYREFGDKVEFFVEDEVAKANGIAAAGVKVFLIDKPYNQDGVAPGIIRVGGLMEILDHV